MKKSLLVITVLMSTLCLSAQISQSFTQIFKEKYVELGYQRADIEQVVITDQYTSNGVQHVYFQQYYNGIPVIGTHSSLHIGKDKTIVGTPSFHKNLKRQIKKSRPTLAAAEAMDQLVVEKKIDIASLSKPIESALVYVEYEGELTLCWSMEVSPINRINFRKYLVSAQTGALLQEISYTTKCHFPVDHSTTHQHSAQCMEEEVLTLNTSSGYAAFAKQVNGVVIPFESPLDGTRNFISNPVDTIASPLGWHRTNRRSFQITRGNNAHAYTAFDGGNTTQNNEPNGGVDLLFQPPFDPENTINENADALVVNNFFMTNYMHDFAFRHGFDEASGNFQTVNLTGEGEGNDEIKALVGHDFNVNFGNNAFFVSPPDGQNGEMYMQVWGRVDLTGSINEPASIAQDLTLLGDASFGPGFPSNGLTGEIVEAVNADGTTSIACDPILNQDELEGKIALIDRGDCFFVEKVRRAQNADAIAVVICNTTEDVVQMGGTANDVLIPSVMLPKSVCDQIRINTSVSITISASSTRPPIASDLDNVIIAHEYGHGISTRLTGGPSNSDCLFNDEQMGEGWSDFFGLVTTTENTDSARQARPIGSYSLDQLPTDGIRRFPYSVNQDVNPLTMLDLRNTNGPHELGTIWASALWDMYWLFVDRYGFNDDLKAQTGGNNIAVKLVMDAMRMQSCNPGFEDGRNALLQADTLMNNAANSCLIWEAFANRGMGVDFSQNNKNNRRDNVASFLPPSSCATLENVTVRKQMTDVIEAGDTITVTVEVENKIGRGLANLTLVDQVPANASLVGSDSSAVRFVIDTLVNDTSIIFEYQLVSDPDLASLSTFSDLVDEATLFRSEGTFRFISDDRVRSGNPLWYANVIGASSETVVLQSADAIAVPQDRPLLAFEHRLDTEPNDVGFVEISLDNENWTYLGDTIKNGYNQVFIRQNQVLNVFAGTQEDFETSIFDLSDYAGQNVYIRFVLLIDNLTSSTGWAIDNIHVFDQQNYTSQVCLQEMDGNVCVVADTRGSIVLPIPAITSSTTTLLNNASIKVFPNPAVDELSIVAIESGGIRSIEIIDVLGRKFKELAGNSAENITLSVRDLPTGQYILRVQTDEGLVVQKMVIGR